MSLSAAYRLACAKLLVSTTNVSQTRIGTTWQRGHTPMPPAPSLPSLPGLLGAAGAVVGGRRVARRVVGVVVVVEEVPAGDVVDVAVAVVVAAVAERDEQVAGVEDAVGLVVAGGRRDARVVRVVVDVEGAVVVAVVLAAALRRRQLARVQRDLLAQRSSPQRMPVSRIATRTSGRPIERFHARSAETPGTWPSGLRPASVFCAAWRGVCARVLVER